MKQQKEQKNLRKKNGKNEKRQEWKDNWQVRISEEIS